MSMQRFCLGVSALILSAFPIVCRGETLADALADAYVSNPNLRAARAQLRAIDEDVVQAGAAYRLTMSVEISSQWARQRIEASNGRFVPTRSDGAQILLSATQILFNGGRTASQVSSAEAQRLAGREQLRQAENDILFEVIDAYASVLRDQEVLKVRQQSVEAFGRQVDASRARRRSGDLTLTDTSQAEAQLNIAQVSLEQARLDLQSSRARFAAVVGRNPAALEPIPALPAIPSNAEAAFAQARQTSPALQRAIMLERASSARVSRERSESMPIVSVDGGIGYSGPPELNGDDFGRIWNGAVRVRIPIMQGGVVRSRVRQAEALREQASYDALATERAVLQQLQFSWNQAVTAIAQQRASAEAVRAATISSEGSRKEFREGYRSTFEVLNEEQRLLDAKVIYEQAKYRDISARAQVLSTLGLVQGDMILEGVDLYDAPRRSHVDGSRIFEPISRLLDEVGKPSGKISPQPSLQRAANPRTKSSSVPGIPAFSTDLPISGPSCDTDRC